MNSTSLRGASEPGQRKGLARLYLEHIERTVTRDGRATPSEVRRTTERAWWILRAFYAYLFFLSFPKFGRAAEHWVLGRVPEPRLHLELPALIPISNWNLAALLAATAMLLGSLTCVFSPERSSTRILAAAGFVVLSAIEFDQNGKINHGNHLAMWVAIGSCFLPQNAGGTERTRRDFLTSFLGLQLIIGMLYSSAGICKIVGVIYDWPEGVTWFHPDALPLTIAGNWKRSSTTLLGGFLVMHPAIAMAAQVGALCLELFALPAMMFRQLQRPWALGLLVLHTMVLASMRIHFHESCIVLLLFLAASPFACGARESVAWLRARLPRLLEARAGSRRDVGGAAASPHQPAPARRAALRAAAWPPLFIGLYLVLAFHRFDPERGQFEQELFPISPLPMFFRVHSGEREQRQLKRVRRKLERHGYFPERTKRALRMQRSASHGRPAKPR